MTDTIRRYSLFPKTLASCVEPVTRPLFREHGSAAIRLITEWDAIAGRELARHTRVEKLSFPKGKKNGGTLTVAVENGFALELQHMQPVILERLAEYFGYRAVTRITTSHAFMPAGDRPQTAKMKSPAPLPPDCSRMAEGVDDIELKEALASLAKTLSGERT